MSRKINFSLITEWHPCYNFEIFIDGSTVRCKAARFFSSDQKAWRHFDKVEGVLVDVSEAWLAELDALEIFSWNKEYVDVSKGTGGIWWYLTFKDGERVYRGNGWNIAHKNWSRFMDWLGEIFKEDSTWIKI